MTPEHPRWEEFCERLGGPEGCDFREDTEAFRCAGDFSLATAILKRMGLSEDAVAASLAHFEESGGCCDCEILLNVDASVAQDDDSECEEPAGT